MSLRFHLLASVPALLIASAAQAQVAPPQTTESPPAADAPEAAASGDIVVTGVAQGRNRLDTSVSVSSLDADLTT